MCHPGQPASNERGIVNILLIPFILISVFFVAAAGFAYWSYGNQVQYKANADAVSAQQVAAARKELSDQRDKQFSDEQAQPYGTYTSPSPTGAAIVKYPRSWAVYADENSSGGLPVDAYFYPNFVPDVKNDANNFAIRLRINQQSYDSMLQQYDSYIKKGTVSVAPYRSPNVPNAVGVMLTGQVQQRKQGTMIMLPVRDKTIQLWTESTQFSQEFNDIALKNFKFNQ